MRKQWRKTIEKPRKSTVMENKEKVRKPCPRPKNKNQNRKKTAKKNNPHPLIFGWWVNFDTDGCNMLQQLGSSRIQESPTFSSTAYAPAACTAARNTLVLRLRTLQHARPMGAAANSPRSLGDQPGVGPLRSVVEVAHERLTIEGLAVEIHHWIR